MLFFVSPLILRHFWPASTLLHGHIALALPSLPETEHPISEHWSYVDEGLRKCDCRMYSGASSHQMSGLHLQALPSSNGRHRACTSLRALPCPSKGVSPASDLPLLRLLACTYQTSQSPSRTESLATQAVAENFANQPLEFLRLHFWQTVLQSAIFFTMYFVPNDEGALPPAKLRSSMHYFTCPESGFHQSRPSAKSTVIRKNCHSPSCSLVHLSFRFRATVFFMLRLYFWRSRLSGFLFGPGSVLFVLPKALQSVASKHADVETKRAEHSSILRCRDLELARHNKSCCFRSEVPAPPLHCDLETSSQRS